MPQSYTCLHYHIVFGTKLREPTITPEIRPRLWEYLGGAVRGEGGIPILVGGMADHVHLLVTLRQDRALSDLLRQIKSNSSGWLHDTFPTAATFRWQAGYGAFTVSQSQVDKVRRYIANQERHHKTRTFEEEFRELLIRHGIEFEERYLWE